MELVLCKTELFTPPPSVRTGHLPLRGGLFASKQNRTTLGLSGFSRYLSRCTFRWGKVISTPEAANSRLMASVAANFASQ